MYIFRLWSANKINSINNTTCFPFTEKNLRANIAEFAGTICENGVKQHCIKLLWHIYWSLYLKTVLQNARLNYKLNCVKKLIVLAAFFILAFTEAGCTGEAVIASQPTEIVYAKPAAPGTDYVWIDGDWYWSGGTYVWRNGYWAHASGRTWEKGFWEHRPHGYYWHKGHWKQRFSR